MSSNYDYGPEQYAHEQEERDRVRREAMQLVSDDYDDGYDDGEYDDEEYGEGYQSSHSRASATDAGTNRRRRCLQCYRPASCTRKRLLAFTVIAIGIGVGVAMAVLFIPDKESKTTGKRVGTGEPCTPPDYTRVTWSLTWSSSGKLRDEATDYTAVKIAKTRSTQNVYRAFGSSTAMSADGRRMVVAGRFGDTFHVFDRNADPDKKSRVKRNAWKLSGVIPIVHEHEADTFDELKEAKADVTISGDGSTIACGYPFFRTGLDKSGTREKWGAVVVYRLTDGKWRQFGEPFYGEGPRDYLGQAVSLSEDGTVIAIGELRHTFRTGQVTIYKWGGSKWGLIGTIAGNVKGEQFGGMVSLSNDGKVLAASAMYDGLGSARVYKYEGDGGVFSPTSGTQWTQIGGPVVGRDGYPYFGWPVSLSGDGKRLVASSASFGSDGNIEDGLDRGTVWAFEFNGREWKQLGGKIEGEYGGDGLGWGLAISKDGNVLAAGAPNSGHFGEKAGYVEVYRYHQDDWLRIGKVIRGENVNSRTGVSLSLSGTGKTLAVSSPSDYKDKEGRGEAGDVEMFDAPLDFDCIAV